MSEETEAPPKAPEGWLPLPISVMSVWSPDTCKRPVQGQILSVAQFGPRVIDRGFVMVLEAETDAVAIDGDVHAVAAGERIVVPLNYVLVGLAKFVEERQRETVRVWIGPPKKLPILGAELYGFEVRVAPQTSPR